MGHFKSYRKSARIGAKFILGLSMGVGMTLVRDARSELVFDEQPQAADREASRKTLAIAEKTVAPEPVAAVPAADPLTAPQITVAPGPAPTAAYEPKVSRSEALRRERMRQELKNEDALQERLEELRMRDEAKRLDALVKSSDVAAEQAVAPVAATGVTGPTGPVQMQTQVIDPANGMAATAGTSEAKLDVSKEADADKLIVSLSPRFGMTNMVSQSQAMFNIIPRFGAGVGMGLSFSENMSIELGYSYNEYGVAMSSLNPWVAMVQAQGMAIPNQNFETLAMKQNVFEGGFKFHFLGRDAKLRPFMGLGGGYAKSFINYDSRILTSLNQWSQFFGAQAVQAQSADYSLDQFLAYVSTGFDLQVSKNVKIGILGKYYQVLSSRENQALYGGAFMPWPNAMLPYGAMGLASGAAATIDKSSLAGSVSRSGFYSIMGTVSFSF